MQIEKGPKRRKRFLATIRLFVAIFRMEGKTPRQHAIFFTRTDNLGFFTITNSVLQTFESYAVIARHENWRPATFVAQKGEVFSDLILGVYVPTNMVVYKAE